MRNKNSRLTYLLTYYIKFRFSVLRQGQVMTKMPKVTLGRKQLLYIVVTSEAVVGWPRKESLNM